MFVEPNRQLTLKMHSSGHNGFISSN